MNYFSFFEFPLAPTINQGELKKRFYANSRKYHPDFYTLEDAATQAEVLEKSTLNNQGYKILKDDDQRLKHLLELKGALGEEGKNPIPQDFLIEVMDINEALMELEFDDDPTLRAKAKATATTLESELQAEVADLLDNYDDALVTENELNQLRDYYLKRRYLLRIFEKL